MRDSSSRGWGSWGVWGACGAWIEERTGLLSFARRHGRDFEVPADAGTSLPLGGILLFALVLQIASGALLLIHFVPDPAGAFESVRALMREVPSGWAVRLVHAHGANWMVAIVFVHLFRTAFEASYKRPRELVWLSGCVLFLLVLAAALTGYILPWSQMSYWATTVVTASLQYVPVFGDELVRWVRGGELVGDPTFRRAFAAHVALIPLLLLATVGVHLAWVRRAGLAGRPRRTRPGSSAPASSPVAIPFFPRVAIRYALGCVGFALLLVVSITFVPNGFFPPEHGLPADAFDTPANVKPEWYFLWAYELPRLIPERLALALQGVAVAVLFLLPFLDRGADRHPLDRLWISAGLAFGLLALVGLSVLGYLA